MVYYYVGLLIELIEGRKESESEESEHHMPMSIEKSNNSCYWSCVEEILDFVNVGYRCTSLLLVGIIYWYVKLIDFELSVNKNEDNDSIALEENKDLLQMYMSIMEKLIYFIMTEGWGIFLGRIKNIKQSLWNCHSTCINSKFSHDIFRDI